MGIDSDWARIVAEGQDDPAASRDRQLAALLMHSRSQSIALQQVREALDDGAKVMVQLREEIAAIKRQMEIDAELMAAVRDTTTAAKVFTRGVKWFSGIVVAVAGLWWAYVTFKHGGNGPPDIGVGP